MCRVGPIKRDDAINLIAIESTLAGCDFFSKFSPLTLSTTIEPVNDKRFGSNAFTARVGVHHHHMEGVT